MPRLLKQIEGNILDNFTSEVKIMGVVGDISIGDYIKLELFEGFLQNFSNVCETYEYETPVEFGLLRNKKEEFIKLEISY